jgi:hypothetical protein
MSTIHHTEQITDWDTLDSKLKSYHPLFIEGPSDARDKRCPSKVAVDLLPSLSNSLKARNIQKPLILISQGDPKATTGVSAVMDIVARQLKIQKCLVCLDEDIDPNHAKDANREHVQFECRLKLFWKDERKECSRQIRAAVEKAFHTKNQLRIQNGLGSLDEYHTVLYACLQEVTKAKLKEISGEITVCHTSNNISDFSITSFYKVGIDLGIIQESEMVYYNGIV